jgi:RecB family exonuclease
MKPDEFKSLLATLSNVIDARAKTTETLFKVEIQSAEERLRAEMKAAEERTQAEILAARAEAKADHLQLAGKVDRITKNHKRRLEALEEKTGTPNPNKH